MKQLSLIVVLIAATGISVAFRQGLSGTSEASLSPVKPKVERLKDVAKVDAPVIEPEAKVVKPANHDPKGDLALARIAAECGDLVMSKTGAEGNVRLLEQAAQHFRASLSHEGSVPEEKQLFDAIRDKLSRVEALVKKLQAVPEVEVKEKPVVLEEPKRVEVKPVEVKPKRVPVMVGPDGLPLVPVR